MGAGVEVWRREQSVGTFFFGEGSSKFFCMQNIQSFPSNKPKKPPQNSACGGQTMWGGEILRLVILITAGLPPLQKKKALAISRESVERRW